MTLSLLVLERGYCAQSFLVDFELIVLISEPLSSRAGQNSKRFHATSTENESVMDRVNALAKARQGRFLWRVCRMEFKCNHRIVIQLGCHIHHSSSPIFSVVSLYETNLSSPKKWLSQWLCRLSTLLARVCRMGSSCICPWNRIILHSREHANGAPLSQ